MAFTGKEQHSIHIEEAQKLVRNYQYQHPNKIKAEFFGRDFLMKLLSQDDCVGMRIYYGQDDKGTQHLVVVGAGSDALLEDPRLGRAAAKAEASNW